MADRLVFSIDLIPVAHGDAPDQQLDQLQLLTSIVQQLAAHVETMSIAAAPTKQITSANPTLRPSCGWTTRARRSTS
jgi:hypothetical protein